MFIINILSLIVTIAGALNTGLVGFFNYNFLGMILGGPVEGTYSILARIIFAIIGLGGLWALSFFAKPALFVNSNKKEG
ncbi:MAG: hypothetical protein SP4CHLAM5_03540 [Chlamydiia bacterium]|nr:hypothetical protein [Chlamydiia bacterium]MCH9618228.1 hypothetical protein [Chlamydiia bacterium]MCH9624049.1 hypothetical protein [Chlamydiia bacterium]